MSRVFIFLFLFTASIAFARVNPVNSSYEIVQLDRLSKDIGVERYFSSTRQFKGLFGNKFCSNLETSLKLLKKQAVITYCGDGQRILLDKKGSSLFANKQYQLVRERSLWALYKRQVPQLYFKGHQVVKMFNASGLNPIEILRDSSGKVVKLKSKKEEVSLIRKKKSLEVGKYIYSFSDNNDLLRVKIGNKVAEQYHLEKGSLRVQRYQEVNDQVKVDSVGRVLSLVDRHGCQEKFSVEKSKNTQFHVTRKCGKKVKKKSFLVKGEASPLKALEVSEKQNGKVKKVQFKNGKVAQLSIGKNKAKWKRKSNGLLEEIQLGRIKYKMIYKKNPKPSFVDVFVDGRKSLQARLIYDDNGFLKTVFSSKLYLTMEKDFSGRILNLSSSSTRFDIDYSKAQNKISAIRQGKKRWNWPLSSSKNKEKAQISQLLSQAQLLSEVDSL